MFFFSKSRRLAQVQSDSKGGVSVDIRVDNTIVNGQPIAPRAENEYASNYRGEKNGPWQDEEARGKGDVEADNTKAGEDVYDELDERYIQPQPEKDNWHGKPGKGISSPNTEGAEYDELDDRHLQPQTDKGKWHGMQNKGRSLPNAKEGAYDDVVSQTDKGKWHGMPNKGRSLPNAREGEYDDVVPQTGKSQSHGKQETGNRSREASEDQCDDEDDGYLVPQSAKSHGRQETGNCSPEASEDQYDDVEMNDGYLLPQSIKLKSHGKQDDGQRSHVAGKDRGNETYLQLKHDDVMPHGKRDQRVGSPGAGETTYERIRNVDDPKKGQDQLPVYDDTV